MSLKPEFRVLFHGFLAVLWLAVSGLPAQAQASEHAAPPAAPVPAASAASVVRLQPGSDEPDLEELLRQELREVPREVEVSAASRFAQSAAQAPAVTYVVTAAEIQRYGMRSLADILRAMPGIHISFDGGFSYIGARGLGRPADFNSRLLVLLDGMRVNENIYDAALIDGDFFADVDLIDRVEYAPGPGSAVYGNNAFLGVVNVITKRVDKLRGFQLRSSLDSEGQKRLRASWGWRGESGWEGWLSSSQMQHSRRSLMNEYPPEHEPALRALKWARDQRVLGGVRGDGISLQAGFSSVREGLPYFLTEDTWDLGQYNSRGVNTFYALDYERSLGAHWDLSLHLSGKRVDFQKHSPFLDGPDTVSFYNERSLGRWINGDLRLSTQLWAGHKLMFGLEYQRDLVQRVSAGADAYGDLFVFEGGNRRNGLFVQDEWRLNDAHLLVLGLRQDRARIGGSSWNPRLAWIWRARPDASFKLLYGSAFRAANLFEFQVNEPRALPTPEPERVRSLEAAWDQALSPQLQLRASAFVSRLRNLISLDDSPQPYFINSPRLRTEGLELGLEKRWDQGAQLRASLSLQRTRDPQGQGLSNSPHALLKLHYSRPLLGDRLQLGWQLQATSRRHTDGEDLPGYVVQNLNLLWRPASGHELSLGLYNLTQTRYFDQPVVQGYPLPQPRRSAQLSWTWSFE
ncbi:TonB-dependent receptor plug domain-containing protein [Paucibacter sp. B51]|uniref:TonB-dependent receptor plug domain-containing protein n=1 Tax=Paucibacter sp. B51 TaxID=2993315 RepID=UPI0022EBE06B|nr:TonB-dependent receptor [Paucibacter sp. B51]